MEHMSMGISGNIPPKKHGPTYGTLWLFNVAMENGPFIDGLPSYKMVDLSMAMLNNQMVQ